MVCKLCKENEASQPGSHLVPDLLLRRIFNITKARDKEILFIIKQDFNKLHYGRGILPDQLQTAAGDPENLLNYQNPFKVDNYFCRKCEQNFSNLESEYAPSLKVVVPEVSYNSKADPKMAFTFWTSIVFRSKFINDGKSGLNLSETEQESIRVFLHNYFKGFVDESFWQNTFYVLMRSPNYSDDYGTLYFSDPNLTKPYCTVVDEFVLFYYLNETDIIPPVKPFFGFEHFLISAQKSSPIHGEWINRVRHVDFNIKVNEALKFMKDLRMNSYSDQFDVIHQLLGGEGNMPGELKKAIINEIVNSGVDPGYRYSREHVGKCVIEVLNRYVK